MTTAPLRWLIVCVIGALLSTPLAAQVKDSRFITFDKLNTEADETDPFVFGNGTNFLYASNKNGKFELWWSKRTTPPVWPAGKIYYSQDNGELRSPFYFKEYVYFTSSRIADEKLKDLRNYDIVKRLDMQLPIPLLGIATAEDEMNPYITASGRELYFSRKTKDGWIQMVAEGPDPGPIGKARSVGFEPGFHHASVTADGKVMYLEGPLDAGKIGIFRSRRTRLDGPWSKPEQVPVINHPESKRGDMAPFITADGTRIYFASDRPGGKGGLDLYSALISTLR